MNIYTAIREKKELSESDILSTEIYNTLTIHASTLISKTDARIISDLLATHYKHMDATEVTDNIISGIYESDLAYQHPMNIALISKFIRNDK